MVHKKWIDKSESILYSYARKHPETDFMEAFDGLQEIKGNGFLWKLINYKDRQELTNNEEVDKINQKRSVHIENKTKTSDSSNGNWFTKLIENMIDAQYEKEMAQQKADYIIQKNLQRNFWGVGAQKFLREQKMYLTSAWMLEHALQDNPSDIWRGNDSRIAYLINHDPEYLSKLDDTYDFTELQTFMDDNSGWSTQAGLGTVANDAAVWSQVTDAINPYKVHVEFFTTR